MNVTAHKRLAAILFSYILLFSAPFLLPKARLWQLLLAAGLLVGANTVFLFFGRRKESRRRAFAVLALVVVAVCAAFLYSQGFLKNKIGKYQVLADGETHDAVGYVSEVLYEKPYGSSYYIKLISVDGETADGKMSLSLPFAGELSPYDEISFSCVFSANEADYDSYLKSKGIVISGTSEDIAVTGMHRRGLLSWAETVRAWIAGNFEAYIGGREAGFATALLTGNRDALDGQLRLAYKRLGLSHILAVSGLHLSVIVGGADFLMRKLTVSKRKKNVFLLLLILFFAMICGFSSSVTRAAVMLGLFYLAELLGERSDSLTSLVFAVALILTVRPFSVYDAGLWLSFLATLGIVTISPFLDGLFAEKAARERQHAVFVRILRSVVSLLVMTFTATFFTMPVTYLLYGGVSLVSPLANLVFVPLTEIILYLLVFLTVFSFLPFVPALLGSVCRFLIAFSTGIAEKISDIEGIYISIRYPFAGVILAVLVTGVTAVLLVKKLNPGWMLAVFLVCTVAFGGAYGVFHGISGDAVKIFVESDGKSDAVGFVCGGKSILVDIGTGGYAVPSQAADSFADYYECEIDMLVLTHLHSYHAGMVRKLADKMKIHHVLLPEPETDGDSQVVEAILSALDGVCDVSFYPRDGSSYLECGALKLHLPDYLALSRSVHPVVAFYAEIGGDSSAFVYAGASAFELSSVSVLSENAAVVVCGTHGPVMKNIFAPSCFSGAEYVVFIDKETARYTELDRIMSKVLFMEDTDGRLDLSYEK